MGRCAMKVWKKWREHAFADLGRILRALGPPAQTPEYLEALIWTINQRLDETDGRPPESVPWVGVMPEARVWELIDGLLWLVIVVRQSGGFWSRLFRGPAVEVIIRGVYDHPPSRGDVGLPP